MAVVQWLQNLLRERFHDELVLRLTDGFWSLAMPGSPVHIRIRCDFNAFLNDPRTLPCGHWTPQKSPWLPAGCTGLPTPGIAPVPQPLLERDHDGCVLHYDVLGLSYWMLSRHEETLNDARDANGRFPAEASHAYRHGYLDRPIVDEWLEVLRLAMQAVWPALALHEPTYSLQLSHDVDTPARYALISPVRLVRNMMTDLLRDRHRDRVALLRAPWIWVNSRRRIDAGDPFNTFEWIMDRSEEAGLRNAFYFLCGRTDRKRDGHYEPEHPAILDLMQRIHARGHEVGLHPSYGSHLDAQVLETEALRLRRNCELAGLPAQQPGARMHYLRWHTPTTAHGLEAAGLAYDTTLGYAKHPGFRCGTCHEYQAIDPVLAKPIQLRLRPLIVMESTVISNLNTNNAAAAQARLLHYMQACRRVRGCFTLLWHNTMLEQPLQRWLYERVLHHHREASQ